MTRLRVVQVNCVIDEAARAPGELLDAWPTLPAIAEATAAAGAEVTVVQASRFDATDERAGVSYMFVHEPRLRGVAGCAPWRLARAVRGLRPDVIHLNGLDFPFHARALAALGVPMLVQDHASTPWPRLGRLRRWGHARAAAFAFTAETQAEPFVAAGELAATARVFAIPESSSRFTPGDRAAERAETGVHGDPALLWVGRLDANKDPLTILRAARLALAQLPGLHLWYVFAGGPLLAEVEAMLHFDPILAGRFHLIGAVPHARVETLLRASDLFVLGSGREGSGYALIEAMACGVAPVVSRIPSFAALTGDGAIGALAPRGDVEAFAAAIVRVWREPAANVRAHFDRHLSFEAVGRRLVAAYEAIAR